MPYFPQTYPLKNWWAGKTFVREAERVLAAEASTGEHSKQQRIIVYENLVRAIRTLLELPPAHGYERESDETELAAVLPDGFPWGTNTENAREAITQTRDVFFHHFRADRYEEYTRYGWENQFDAAEVALILDIPEAAAEVLLDEWSFTEEQSKLLDESYQSQEDIDASIAADHDRYWEMEEVDLLGLFGHYGEFRG
jgi:hypothetical protein